MKQSAKVLSVVLALCMMLSIVPMSALAAFDYAHNEASSSDDYYNLISKKDWDIAPGITESEIVLNNDAGDRRQVVHLMSADINNEYTRVISSYTNMDTSNYAVSTIPEHAAWIENNWNQNVVGAMNTCLSWYNSAAYEADPSRVNEPLGFMMVDGEVYFDHSVGFPTCIVIHKDVNEKGEARPADIPKVQMRTVNASTDLNGWEDQVIPSSSGYIVENGVNKATYGDHGTGTAARSVVGIKADGSVVIMMNDGRQAPYSLGMTMYECAEVMIAAGCVYASNCDGGGSSTFMSQRPGEDLTVNCSPCDGSLRANTHGIMIISTAPATGEFANAYLSTDSEYYVPKSTVKVNAVGRDFSGAEAAIPEEIVWTVTDPSLGSIENGVFTSNGKLGNVTVQMKYNDAVVGEKTFAIANPEKISFAQESTVIPYGKKINLDIVATIGEENVHFTADDFTWKVSDENAGVRDGLVFTACNDTSKTGVTITATYKHAEMNDITLNITFGKGSEILYNFEDGDISNWLGKSEIFDWARENNPNSPVLDASPFAGNFTEGTYSKTFLATKENGKVKNGNYALGVEVDYTYSGQFGQWAYNMFFNVEGPVVLRDVANDKNATRFGMWIYIPEELAPGHNLAMQTEFYCGSSAETAIRKNTHLILSTTGKTLTASGSGPYPEDRWVYCYMDLSAYNYVSFQDPYNAKSTRREPQFIRFYTQSKVPFNSIFYFDDMTLDYSSAVDDRDAPVISNLTVNTEGNNKRSFNANIADFAASNASGLNYASAKILVDGVELPGITAAGNTLSSGAVDLTSGAHTVSFIIADNLGNVMKNSTTFNIAGTAPVYVAGRNDLNKTPEYDSVYYLDIKATDAEKIDSITTDIYLNYANNWELDNMTVAEGFEATYKIDEYTNVATITVTRKDSTLTGAQTLVTLPVRVWSWSAEDAGFGVDKIGANSYPTVTVDYEVRMGKIVFAKDSGFDGYFATFSGKGSVATAILNTVTPDKWHVHTAEAVEDVAATCTKDGYTGRTYCKECGSVVDWGTTQKATGHNWAINAEGKLACANNPEELFNGVYTDGKIYVDGVVLADGWNEDKTAYYKDGVKVTGSIIIDGVMCTFDENGVYLPNNDYTGFYETEDGKTMYILMNVPQTGYQQVFNKPYFFDNNGIGYEGTFDICGETCTFENAEFVSCSTADVIHAGMAGESIEYVLYSNGTLKLEGTGSTYGRNVRGYLAWNEYRDSVKKVVIGKGVNAIGDHAFSHMYKLTTIEFENGSQLTKIGNYAFHFAQCVSNVELPALVSTIGFSAFGYCKGLDSVYFPDLVSNINKNVFTNSGKNFTLSVAEGSYAEAFAKTNGYTYETRVAQYGPADILPGEEAIVGGTCGANASWALYLNGRLVISGSGAMDDYTRTTIPWIDYVNQIRSVKIGKDITSIGSYAFGHMNSLTTVSFEEGSKLTSIGHHAFHFAGKLESIVIPDGVKTFGYSALGYCAKLVNVQMSEGASSIDGNTFWNHNANLKLNVVVGSKAEIFAENKGIKYETRESKFGPADVLPGEVAIASGTCGVNATWEFYSDGRLVISGSGDMYNYERGTTPWNAYANQIRGVKICKDITSIGNYAFGHLNNLANVSFEEGSNLNTIGHHAFHFAGKLKSVVIPDGVKSFGYSALGYCANLVEVKMPEGASGINANTFWNHNAALKLDVVAGSASEIFAKNNNISYTTRESKYGPYDVLPGEIAIASGTCGTNATWALYTNGRLVISGKGAMDDYTRTTVPWIDYVNQIRSVKIGKEITAIGSYAFGHMNNLINVSFEEGSKLISIGHHAFHFAGKLKSIVIPDSVKTFGYSALGYCANLVDVQMSANATAIDGNTFWNHNANLTLNVVAGSYAETFANTKGIATTVR